jgi:hypothetical protein
VRRCVAYMVVAVLMLAVPALAQKKVLTASYLRASIGAINDRSSVTIRGEYMIDPGMVEASGRGLRNKGYSRFSVRDPYTGARFDSMYCKQESDVFWRLLKAKENTLFIFQGEKGRGENREGAIFTDRLESVLLTPTELAERRAGKEAEPRKPLRVTLVKEESGLRTVLTAVERGKPYKIDGLTVIVEDEPEK